MRVSYRVNGVIISQKDYEIHLAKFKSSDNWLLCKIRNHDFRKDLLTALIVEFVYRLVSLGIFS